MLTSMIIAEVDAMDAVFIGLAAVVGIAGGILAIHDVFPNPEEGGRPPFNIYLKAKESGLFKEVDMINSLALLEKL